MGSEAVRLPRLITAKELAERLQLRPWRIYELVREGELPCVRIGASIRFSEDAIAEWIRQRTHNTTRAAASH
jgi:putative molybdopterin biosynthesis protein